MEMLLPLDLLPLGFRFRPTDEELINHYLKGKISGRGSGIEVIPEVDVCKCEPWDLPDKSIIRTDDDSEWFFFVPRDRKYPNGQRSNRATEAGYWKATGKDRKIKSRSPRSEQIGTKKTLVFYRGRAPNGERTNWIMHEYRANENGLNSNEGPQGAFVLCRLFRKPEEKTENPSLHVENSSCDVVDPSGFSPATSKSSPEDLLMDTDDPTSKKASPHLAEGPQSRFAVTESGELIDVDKWLEELVDNGTPDPPPMQNDLKCGNDMEGPDQDAPVSSFEPALQSLDSNVPLESSDGGLPSDDWQHTGNPNACVEQNVSNIWEQWFNSNVDEFPEEWTENSVEDVGDTGIKIRNRKHQESDSNVLSLQGSAPRRIKLQSKMVKICHSDLDHESEAEAAEINVSEIYGSDSDHEAEAEVTEARGRILKHVSDAKPERILPDQVSVAATPPANRNHLWSLNRRQRKDKVALQQDEHGEVESPNKSMIESSSFGRRSREKPGSEFQSKPSMSSSGGSFVASNSKTRLRLAVIVCLAIFIILFLLTAVWGDLIVWK